MCKNDNLHEKKISFNHLVMAYKNPHKIGNFFTKKFLTVNIFLNNPSHQLKKISSLLSQLITTYKSYWMSKKKKNDRKKAAKERKEKKLELECELL